MSKTPLGALVRQLRQCAGLTQSQLASRSEVSQQRISAIERNDALIGREECGRLASVLSVRPEELLALVQVGFPRSSLNGQFTDQRSDYTPPSEKTGAERYRAGMASCPDLLAPLWQGLDGPLQAWLESAPTDSLDEWMLLVHRAAAGLRPSRCSPQRLGIRAHPAVCWTTGQATGDLAYPVLLGEVAGLRQVIVPQLCLRPVRTRYRLDFALVVLADRRRFVIDGEVDGTGHRSRIDRIRARELGLLELRFEENLVFRHDFNDLFDVRLRRLLPLRTL